MKNSISIISLAVIVCAAAACSTESPSRVKASASAPAPALLESGPTTRAPKAESLVAAEPGRQFDSAHRWELSDPAAVTALKGNAFGEKEITEFWTKKGWRLTKHEERYMAEVDKLVAAGKIKMTTHWAQTPYNGVYQSVEAVTVDGVSVPKGTEFWFEFCENEDELQIGKPTFARSKAYIEENAGQSTAR